MIEDRWTADESFIFEDSGIIINMYERSYYKNNKGKAIVAVIRRYLPDKRLYVSPFLISTNQNYVDGYCDYNTYLHSSVYSLKYKGLIWYIAQIPYGFFDGNNATGFAKTIVINNIPSNNDEDLENVFLAIVKAANVRLTYSQNIHNGVKDKILNNSLFQKYCIPYENEEE